MAEIVIEHRGNLVLPQIPRTGLGHALGVYARAFVYHASGQAQFVHPNWFKIRIGPYLRREADKRDYHRIIKVPEAWGLPRRHAARRLWMKVVTEDTFDPKASGQFLVVRDDGPVHPRSWGAMNAANPYRQQLFSAFRSMSVFEPRPREACPSIGVFHRSGDFKNISPSTTDERLKRTHGYGYYPPEFAAEALSKVREIAGWQVPAVLSTDASLDEVAPILAEGAVRVSDSRSTLSNMLEMSRHDVIVMGSSMYARWSWFLGSALAVTPVVGHSPKNWIDVPDRKFAWFVFKHETSLNEPDVAQMFKNRLLRQ